MALKGIGASYRGEEDSSSDDDDEPEAGTFERARNPTKKPRGLQLSYRAGAHDSDTDGDDDDDDGGDGAGGHGNAENDGSHVSTAGGGFGSPFQAMRGGGRPSPLHAKITPRSSPLITKHASESQSPAPTGSESVYPLPPKAARTYPIGTQGASVATYDSYPFADTKLELPKAVIEGCSEALLETVKKFIRHGRNGMKFHKSLASRKEFRNPIFYSATVADLDLDEFGSKYESGTYNPSKFDVNMIGDLRRQYKEYLRNRSQQQQQQKLLDASKATFSKGSRDAVLKPKAKSTSDVQKAEKMKRKALEIIAKKLKNLKPTLEAPLS